MPATADRRKTTARIGAAFRDIGTVRAELDWLEAHLGDLDVIGFGAGWQAEQVRASGRRVVTSGPVLADSGQPQVRRTVGETVDRLAAMARQVTAQRVACERLLAGPGADIELVGSELTRGELERLRTAQGRRLAHEGDARWGEWEARQ